MTSLITLWSRQRRSYRTPQPSRSALAASIQIKRNLAWSALRWVCVSSGVITATVYLLFLEANGAGGPACVGSPLTRMSLVHVWTIVASARIFAGACMRVILWLRWDVSKSPYLQIPPIYGLVRAELIVSLLSVMWTTVCQHVFCTSTRDLRVLIYLDI